MSTVAELTLSEKILLTASNLDELGQSPFSAEALIVGAWTRYPRAFGLKGYTDQYPDSNKVLSAIMGEKGLTKRGWLSKVGQKLYSLTRDGRQVARRLCPDGEDTTTEAGPVSLSQDQEGLLQTLLATNAVDRFREGRHGELAFPDACRFWNITNGMQGSALDSRLDRIQATLAAVDRLIGTGSATLRDGREISHVDTSLLADVHDYLQQRFSRHLALLRKRGEEA